jgi:hypothetical protein
MLLSSICALDCATTHRPHQKTLQHTDGRTQQSNKPYVQSKGRRGMTVEITVAVNFAAESLATVINHRERKILNAITFQSQHYVSSVVLTKVQGHIIFLAE